MESGCERCAARPRLRRPQGCRLPPLDGCPKTIAVTLNTGASRNMLRATIEDVVAAIDEARERLTENGGKGRDVPDKATWLAQREKMTRPPTGVAKGERARNPLQRAQTASLPVVHAHGATAEAYPVVGEPNATAVAPAVAPVAAAPAVAPWPVSASSRLQDQPCSASARFCRTGALVGWQERSSAA